jgi:aryl-alcohol dehydrogenase-like predicted oxidoreductase
MDYVKFGSTGLNISPLASGMVFREQTDEREALKIVEAAIDRGINLLDCANTYGPADDRSFGPVLTLPPCRPILLSPL